jgi:LacI family transcriptional regulator
MSVTLRDVAKRCGLSPSTVSGVLNNRSNTWASAETRRRIQEAAESLGYRPNHAARALRTGRTHVVTFLFHQFYMGPQSTFDGTAEIMAARLGLHGYELKLHVYPSQGDLMAGLSDLVSRQSCDAILLFGQEYDVAEQGQYLEQYEIPFVVKGRHEVKFPNWYQVDYDHEGMIEGIVRRFVSQGHRRIAFAGFAHGGVYQERLLSGFQASHQQFLGIPPEPNRIALSKHSDDPRFPEHITSWFTLPREEQPTAIIIGAGDPEWHLIERELALQGRTIGDGPDQVAVAGQASPFLRLAYGQGHIFADVGFASIGQVAVDDLLLPLLCDEVPACPIQRILPELVPAQQLNLPTLSPSRRIP